ncbi:hypothetical protein DOZ80_17350 [Pseudomonas fluorescens]|uniref:Uncharacterized protein n=1 Tax=Pseudomonas fluorescens TaxID=294 RepID=A0A327N6I9_PSEFL|nr:hypothetical protein DOZ80_17350 [Pseudomonas fluorescens]
MSQKIGVDHDSVGAGLPAIRSLSLVWALGTPSLASQLLQRMFVARDFRRSRLAGDQVLEPCMGLGDTIAGKPAPTKDVRRLRFP